MSDNQTEITEVPFFVLEERKKEERKNRDLLKTIKTFVLPIFTLIGFFAIILLLIVPKVAEIFAHLDEVTATEAEQQRLVELRTDLQTLAARTTEVRNDLAAINAAVPTGSATVTQFQQRVINLATQNSLQVNQAVIGEQVLTSSEIGGARSNLSLLEIPAEFTVVGSLVNVKSFIDNVLALEDFVLIGEMRLNESTGQLWTLQITLLKYQFPTPDADNNLESVYSNIPPTVTLNEGVMEVVRN